MISLLKLASKSTPGLLLVAAAASMAGGGVANAGAFHVGAPGAPITIIIHTPHPECWVCVD